MESPAASDSPFRPWHLWFTLLMTLVGIGIILYGCVRLGQTRNFVARAVHAQATIVDNRVYTLSSGHHKFYQPILRFVDPAGKTWEKNIGQPTTSGAFPIGHSMEIIYDPEHPDQFVPWTGIWSDAWTVGGGAFLVLLFSILTLYVRYGLRHPDFGRKWAWLDRYLVPLRIVVRLLGR